MFNLINPDCQYDNGNVNRIGNVHCPIKVCYGKLCIQIERIFNFSAEATVDVFNARPGVGCSIFPLNSKQIRFS